MLPDPSPGLRLPFDYRQIEVSRNALVSDSRRTVSQYVTHYVTLVSFVVVATTSNEDCRTK